MPTGTFYSGMMSPSNQTGGGSTGAPSQPRRFGFGDDGTSSAAGWRGGVAPTPTAGGSGYTTQGGSNQFPQGQGPSAVMPGSIAQYPTSQYPSYNPYGAAQSVVDSLYGPQQQLLADQLARQREQLGMVGMDADYKTDALRRDNALALQALGLDREALGIDRNLTNTQIANLGRLRAILGQQFGLNDRDLANRMRGFSIDEATARDMAKRNLFDLRSNLTARGAFGTIANERGTGRVSRDLMYQLGHIDVGREGARIGHQGTRLGLQEKGIGYDNQEASLNARLANIGLDTQRLGISEQQLANSLEDGLHQIGLSSLISVNGLLDAIGGTNMQQAQLAATILGEVASYGNLPPEVLAAIQQAMAGVSSGAAAGTSPSGGGAVRYQ